MNRSTNPRVDKIARDLESFLDRLRGTPKELEGIALATLSLECQLIVDRLDALAVPPIAGGAPDDSEGWPAEYTPELDGYTWTTEPTPLEVLADEEPFDPAYDRWLDRLDAAADAAGRFDEADAIACHGCA